MPEPYTIDTTDRMAVNRVRQAAKRGDKRAEATLDEIEQQLHTDRWQAAEQARADRESERANRRRHTSVAGVMDERRKARHEKQERAKQALAASEDKPKE